jgi:hypothetical protein
MESGDALEPGAEAVILRIEGVTLVVAPGSGTAGSGVKK